MPFYWLVENPKSSTYQHIQIKVTPKCAPNIGTNCFKIVLVIPNAAMNGATNSLSQDPDDN